MRTKQITTQTIYLNFYSAHAFVPCVIIWNPHSGHQRMKIAQWNIQVLSLDDLGGLEGMGGGELKVGGL